MKIKLTNDGMVKRAMSTDSGADMRAVGFRRIIDKFEEITYTDKFGVVKTGKVKVAGELGPEIFFNDKDASVVIEPHETVLLLTGVAVSNEALNENLSSFKIIDKDGTQWLEIIEGQSRPRSGYSLKMGMLTHFGTIDDLYRGTIGAITTNLGEHPIKINAHERIGQLTFGKTLIPNLETLKHVEDFNKTERGDGGYGHTGR